MQHHHGVEEWVFVAAGEPSLREPAGERVLAPGFSGVAAAGAATVSVYPDSEKLGVRPPGGRPDRLDFRRADAVDYWHGE